MAVDQEQHRRITARTVTLPPEEWYKRIRIPGITTHRSSPYSNSVHTTKYTVFNFLLKNLWEQFHRFANIYFLFLALLNFVPAVQAFGKEVGYLPLLFVLAVTAVKDIFQDYRRYKSDKEVNGRLTWVYDWEKGNFVERKWSEVCIGDFIRLSCNEVIPADILLLHSSDPDGICYIETANIDGETYLKQRQVAQGAVETDGISGADDFSPLNFESTVLCEQPHCEIYDFSGYVLRPTGEKMGIDRRNLLLRGCIVRNTTSVVGIVVYAGHETKALLNNKGPSIKRSKLERDINSEIAFQLAILFILCFIGGVGSGIWTGKHVDRNIVYFPYTSDSAVPALEGFIRFWTFIIIFQVIVPISLYISMEVVKFIQVFFINWDIDMYYQPTDRPCQCRALNINEDLGQIHYIFTDKTGTLTENEMVFRCCSIGEKSYSHSLEAEFAKYRHGYVPPTTQSAVEDTDFPNSPKHPLILDSTLQSDLEDPAFRKAYLHDFFVVMAICNTVVISRKDNRKVENQWSQSQFVGVNEDCGRDNVPVDGRCITYEAESPDEAALVEAARSYGYTLVSRSPGGCSILIPGGQLIRYKVLHLLEFDPVRKCMSIIVREEGGSKLILYSKGADSAIYPNLAHHSGLLPQKYDRSYSEDTPTLAELTQNYLSMYATVGLRTLCLARRVLSEEEYSVWLEQHQQAEVALEGRDSLLFHSACKIEKKFELLGVTGIEDRLQDMVPETIENLRSSGIKIWVLTGDKQETAINIGYSSCLIDQDMDIIVINATSMEECRDILEVRRQELTSQAEAERDSSTSSTESLLSRIRPILGASRYKSDSSMYNRLPKALVIDGQTLAFALDERLKVLFLEVARQCRSVICCRVTPLQKAAVVELVKVQLHQMTLAVGDGANDVSMIQKANVGVGIAGKEGMQAVMASDFAVARFRFLEKLLLVHGHWCYSRLARMMLYFFYKNVGLAALLFWFQLFNGFSGSFPIDAINVIMYSLVFTSLPVVVAAIADQDLRANTLLADHTYYEEGQRSKVYTKWKFWLAMLDAFYQSAVVFFVAYGAYYDSDVGITEYGFVINVSLIITVSLHLASETLHWTIINHFILWGSILATFVINYIYTAIDTRQPVMDTYWLMYQTSSRLQFWFVLILTPMISLSPRLIAKVIEQELFPSPVLKARSEEKLLRKRNSILTTVSMDHPNEDHNQNYLL